MPASPASPCSLVEGGRRRLSAGPWTKLAWLRRHGEPLREALMLEPRGHAGMHGALFTEPALPKAHAGLLSMHAGGFPRVSGEAVIAAVTIAVENHIIVFDREHSDDLYIETPAGLLTARPHFLESTEEKDVAVGGVALAGLPGFVHTAGMTIPYGNRTVPVDIAFGGEFYAIADGESVGVPVDAEHAPNLLRAGLGLKQAVDAAITSMRLGRRGKSTASGRHPDGPGAKEEATCEARRFSKGAC